jgi:hypothetical protein
MKVKIRINTLLIIGYALSLVASYEAGYILGYIEQKQCVSFCSVNFLFRKTLFVPIHT